MDDLVKEALPILRVIETKVYVEQGRQELKTGPQDRFTLSAHLKYLFLQSWTNITETWWYFDTCFICVPCLFVSFVLYLLIGFSRDSMISLKEKTVIIQNFLPIDFVTLCDSATILPNSDRDSAEVMQIKTSNQNSTFLTWRPMHRGNWVVECGEIFSVWLADLDQYKGSIEKGKKREE